MDNKNRNIDQFFREELGHSTEQPPSSVWESLEERLAHDRSGKRMPGWWIYLSLLVLLIGGGIGAYYGIKGPSGSVPITVEAAPGQAISAPQADPSSAIKEPAGHSADSRGLHPAVIQHNQASHTPQADAKAHTEKATAFYPDATPGMATSETGPVAPLHLSEPAGSVPQTDLASTEYAVRNLMLRQHPAPLLPVTVSEPSIVARSAYQVSISNTGSNPVMATPSGGTAQKALSEPNRDRPVPGLVAENRPQETASGHRKIGSRTGENAIAVREANHTDPTPVRPIVAQGHTPNEEKTIGNSHTSLQQPVTTLRPQRNMPVQTALRVMDPAGTAKSNDRYHTATEEEALENKVAEPVAEKMSRPRQLSIGVKVGFESGANSFTSRKYVGSVFGSMQLSDKWSLSLQPSVKIGQLNRAYNQETGNYYQAGTTTGSQVGVHIDSAQGLLFDFAYKQTYDSMITSIEADRNFTELELPLLMHYQISPRFSAAVGGHFTFGKIILWRNKVQTLSGLTMTDTIFGTTDSIVPAAPAQFSHPGSTPFSSYTPSALPKNTSPVRFGYSLGLTYTFKEKMMVDLWVQQNLSGYGRIEVTDLRRIFSQTYFRVSLGYTLFSSRKK